MNRDNIKCVNTDYWKAYDDFIPDELHRRSKKETQTIESYNSLFRHFLARLRRRGKCYSKSADMLYYSCLLLIAKLNGNLPIFG
jgi:insertion element IS1 protein InsB